MNVLAARVYGLKNSTTKLTGTVLVNGKPRDDEAFRRISAYVLQDDRLYPHLTVNETLMTAAHFFLPDDFTDEQKKELVASVIAELGLGKTVDTIVGDEKVRGISGGERKRANIAVQLISDPSILFLDEPTSGLDSFQAQAVMEAMKNMTLNGRLVITVIHQPRSSIYDMFDKLLLLSEGRAMYLGEASAALEYFASSGFTMNKFFNPADFFLDVLSPDSRTKELEKSSQDRILLLSTRWNENLDVKALESLKQSHKDSINIDTVPIRNKLTTKRYFRNLSLLFWRSFTELSRDHFTIAVKCVITTFFACIIGAMYSKTDESQASIRDVEGLLFVVVLNQSFNNVIGVLNTFPKEKLIVNRERSSGAYDTLSYFTAKFFAECPINVFPSFVYGCIVYWIAGLDPNRFGYFILILLLLAATAISLGLAVSAVSPNADVANAMGVPLTIVALIFGGFYSEFVGSFFFYLLNFCF
jgi:ABC-type multidrug transport system ATPase subunit